MYWFEFDIDRNENCLFNDISNYLDTSKNKMAPITIFYHGACKTFWARAAPIILTLDHVGAEYSIKDTSEAPEGCGFAVPMVILEDGQHLSQTVAITMALGDKYGLVGKTAQEKNVCLQTMLDLNDLLIEIKPGTLKEKPERLLKWKSVFESRLQDSFFGGEEVSVADFFAETVFTFINFKFGDNYDDFPKLTKWMKSIVDVPAVKKMRASGIDIIPPFMKNKN